MSYQGVKQHYIDDYNANKDKENAEDAFGEFQKRNDGTAMNTHRHRFGIRNEDSTLS